MKEKLILMCFGVALGLICLGFSYPLYYAYMRKLPEGAVFESVEEFQRAMLKRDKRDVSSDQSVSLRSIITPHPSDILMYDLLPNLDVKFQRVRVQTNSCGMRSPERTVEKAEGSIRIALLGDSFAFGWGVEQDRTFARVLEKRLNQIYGEAVHFEVLNFGVPGYSTFQQVELLEEKGLDFSPDIVLVYFVENDFGLPFFIKNVHKKGEMMPATVFAKKSWKRNDPLIDQQNQKLLSSLDPNRALNRLSALLEERGIELLVAINPRPDWHEDRKRLWAVRKNPKIHLLKLREGFISLVEKRKIPVRSLSLSFDPHPSAAKHQLLGEVLAAEMLPHVHQVQEVRGAF